MIIPFIFPWEFCAIGPKKVIHGLNFGYLEIAHPCDRSKYKLCGVLSGTIFDLFLLNLCGSWYRNWWVIQWFKVSCPVRHLKVNPMVRPSDVWVKRKGKIVDGAWSFGRCWKYRWTHVPVWLLVNIQYYTPSSLEEYSIFM